MVKATFATIFARHCKYGSKCGIYYICDRLALEETYVCNTFERCKFNVNPFVRPVYYLSRSVKASNNLQMLALHGLVIYFLQCNYGPTWRSIKKDDH